MNPKRWQRARQVSQYLALVLFLYLFIQTTKEGWAFLPRELFFRLDPLAAMGAALAGRALPARLLWAAVTLAVTVALGRVWCGWLCPLGTTLDWVTFRRTRHNRTSVSSQWRQVKYFLLFVTLVAALFANLTLLILDPITIVTRTLGTVVMPVWNYLITGAEVALYPVGFLQAPLEWIETTLRGNLLPAEQPFYQLNVLLALFFAAILTLNLLGRRFWCRTLCPLGALLGLTAKISWLRREVTPACTECGACASVCPTGTIEPAAGFASDPGECTMCLDCYAVCPERAVSFTGHFGLAEWHGYDPSRRQLLASLGAGVVGVGLLRTTPATARDHPWLIRPPGARENDFLSRCIRCGECMRICPTSGLQPSLTIAGWEGLWTPVLVPRLGYCDYSCRACGQICPSGAIPELTLEEKRQRVIGLAYIDENRCIPWADGRDCIVCEEMCPTPEKAIVLDDAEVVNDRGQTVIVRRPRVIRDLCIGCGICEHKCPLNGEAAIRVYVPNEFDYAELAQHTPEHIPLSRRLT